MRSKTVNLALQGGGALGALTWGMLDRLLEEPRISIEAISATSAGAMNAAVLASGFANGGPTGARASLSEFWHAVGSSGYSLPSGNAALAAGPARMLAGLTRMFSPYQLNPFDINPLRNIVARLVDFPAFRSRKAIRLFIAATRVRTGALRLFENRELSEDALLASACLPTLHHAIEIDGDAYWDGGYSGNPALYPLVYQCRTPSILVMLLQPLERADVPTSAEDIRSRLAEFQFNASFLREMRGLALARAEVESQGIVVGRLARRLRSLDFHVLEAAGLIARLRVEKTLNVDLGFLLGLRDEGRAQAEAWLLKHYDRIGRESSIDLGRMFG